MQPKRDWATFNIRKVQRKGTYKQAQEIGLFTPEFQFEKYPEAPTYTNPKKEKEFMIDYSVNQAILNSKAYCDLKNIYNENKVKNSEAKKNLEEEVQRLKKQKQQALAEEQRLENQTKKYEQLLAGLKERIISTRQKNRQTREFLQSRMNNEAEYLSNIILSMRFQAEYYHDIDPDQMSYEELLQLQQKIGSVCKGLPLEVIEKLPFKKLQENIEDQCTICFCGLEAEEVVIILPPCEHKFHDGCVKQWLAKEKVCPLCKRQVEIK